MANARYLLAHILLCWLAMHQAHAQAASAGLAGLWKQLDDETGKPRSLIRIAEQDGRLLGSIERLYLDPDESTQPRCERCGEDGKGKPLVGLTILDGMVKRNAMEFDGGKILDPETGRLYRCTMLLDPDGKHLHVWGYLGVPSLGRTQVWERMEE